MWSRKFIDLTGFRFGRLYVIGLAHEKRYNKPACDAISSIEMYVSLDPVKRRTPQTTKVISEYAERGNCDYALCDRDGAHSVRSWARRSDVKCCR